MVWFGLSMPKYTGNALYLTDYTFAKAVSIESHKPGSIIKYESFIYCSTQV